MLSFSEHSERSSSAVVFQRSGLSALAVFVIAIAMTACAPQAPQRPSQRSGQPAEPDSMTLAMVELHQRLADAADVELTNYIRNHPGQWISQDDGSWYSPNPSGVAGLTAQRSSSPQDGLSGAAGPLSLRLITRDLDGKLLSDVEGEYELGKCQLPEAVENCLSASAVLQRSGLSDEVGLSAQRSNHFKILAPWYVAYGSKGNDAVPQYQNVIIEVYIL